MSVAEVRVGEAGCYYGSLLDLSVRSPEAKAFDVRFSLHGRRLEACQSSDPEAAHT
jgi:hypothetical protein